MIDLDARLLAAHAAEDKATLVTLYRAAAEAAPDDAARAFFLTQAHVYALEIGHMDTAALRAALIDLGCETPV